MTKRKLYYGLAFVLFAIAAALVGYGALYERFTNPSLTETQVLLAYWEVFSVGAILLIVGHALVVEVWKRDE